VPLNRAIWSKYLWVNDKTMGFSTTGGVMERVLCNYAECARSATVAPKRRAPIYERRFVQLLGGAEGIPTSGADVP
jgi:hypothetical protein